ncbi:MAG: ParA family protein [bacterium]
MCRIIALANQKGGCGKTTTAVNLSTALTYLHRKVLLIDLDPQGNASIHIGIKIYDLEVSMYDVLVDPDRNVKSVVINSAIKGLDIAPANIELSGAEVELVNVIGRESALKDSMNGIENEYDYIIIDCPPSLGLLTLNALTTAKEVMIPVQTEYFALEGMKKLLKTIDVVIKRLNHNLIITGILATMYDARTNLSEAILKKIKEHFKDKVYETKIRNNVRLAEAPSFGLPIEKYAPNSFGAQDYHKLAKEVISYE